MLRFSQFINEKNHYIDSIAPDKLTIVKEGEPIEYHLADALRNANNINLRYLLHPEHYGLIGNDADYTRIEDTPDTLTIDIYIKEDIQSGKLNLNIEIFLENLAALQISIVEPNKVGHYGDKDYIEFSPQSELDIIDFLSKLTKQRISLKNI